MTAPESGRLSAGSLLGPYRIVRLLGAGGMGEVYHAHDTKLAREVALKILPGHVSADPHARARFEREARAVAALNHPHIVTIHDITQIDGVDCIVMELVTGQSLDRIITSKGLPLDRVIDYGAQIALALDDAHRAGIVHRDIKPANIMVTDAGQVKILDFGLAKVAEDLAPGDATITGPTATTVGTILGTVAYMSPEQAQGQPIDVRSDVFSFGAVLYEMLAGRRAFSGDTVLSTLASILAGPPAVVASVRKDVPGSLARLVGECLARDRADRPTASAISRQLAALSARNSRRIPGWVRAAIGVAAVTAVALGAWGLKRNADVRWAKSTAVAEIQQLFAGEKRFEAVALASKARKLAPDNLELTALWSNITSPLSVASEPTDADVAVAHYGSEAWVVLGRTPIVDATIPTGVLRLRVSKPGYAPVEDLTVFPAPAQRSVELTKEADAPPGMVRTTELPDAIPTYLIPGADPVLTVARPFWIDRYEVTNREFKAFMDAGGYRRREFWTQPFVKGGRVVTWEHAMAAFVDATGRPGPATWQGGTFPDGQADFPVGGVSWYEAHAYLTAAKKSLPSLAHWYRVAGYGGIARILPVANLDARGPLKVGTAGALHRFGAHDLAGNVKEWVVNGAGGDLKYIVGGAWDEPRYMFTERDARPAFERSANFGIRGARFDDGDATVAALVGPINRPNRNFAAEAPAPLAVFEAYRRHFAYDRTPVTATIRSSLETHPEWRVETVAFPAAYGTETVVAYVFLPKQATPPFQAVVFSPGASQFVLRSSQNEIDDPMLAHVIRSGRAVVVPIVKGAYERGTDHFTATTSKDGTVWRDYLVAYYKDIARTLDYLETRSDIARERIGFVGQSRGAALAPISLALEPVRLKTAVLMIPGFYLARPAPEVDVFNFAPRVTQPVLMLSGRFDFIFPEVGSQLPFFQSLGTQGDRKRRVAYDTGHNLPPAEMIKETLDWLDRTLGPVRR